MADHNTMFRLAIMLLEIFQVFQYALRAKGGLTTPIGVSAAITLTPQL